MITQILLGLLGGTAVLLTYSEIPRRRAFAPIFGLCAQPFWFYTTYTHEQWAIFVLSFLYTYGWWRGFRTYWLK